MRTKDRSVMERMKEYAVEYAGENKGRTPSTAELGKKFGMTRQSAFRYLKAMDELGMIRYEDGEIYTDYIAKKREPGMKCFSFSEGITAGTPAETEGYVDAVFDIPSIFTDGRKGNYFMLEVKGDSMLHAGIEPGDLVLCRQEETANTEDIIAAYIRGEGSTLKRLCRDDEGPYLWAENNDWPAEKRFYGREFDIQGVAIKVLKNIDYKEAERGR